MKRSVSLIVLGVLTMGFPLWSAANDSLVITVNPGARQSFGGLGFNLTSTTLIGWPTDTLGQKTFVQNMIRHSKFRNIVLWGDQWMTTQNQTTPDTSQVSIVPRVLSFTRWAQEAGVDFIMLVPIRDLPLREHLTFWTQCAQMWRNRGINLNAMTFLNKPNTGQNGVPDSGKKRRTPAEIVTGVKELRAELDRIGLSDVRIGGPSIVEWHPRTWFTYGDRYDFIDGDTASYLNALIVDDAAMASLAALDMQTYGTGIGNWAHALARNSGKEFWVSLSATDAPYEWDANHPNGKNSILNGPIAAATCLSDLNHGVSRWNSWIVYNLVKNASPSTPEYFGRFHYLSAISTRFDQAARFRQCTATHSRLPTPDMRWNYNRLDSTKTLEVQPDIMSAAAQNPDGSWTVGVINVSSIRSQHKASDDLGAPRTYRVTVRIPELETVPSLTFSSAKCMDVTGIRESGAVVMHNGMMSFSLSTRELIVLRSQPTGSPIVGGKERTREGWMQVGPAGNRQVRIQRLKDSESNMEVKVTTPGGRLVHQESFGPGTETYVHLAKHAAGSYLMTIAAGKHTLTKQIVLR